MSPLHSLHEAAGAEFQPWADIPIVSTFGATAAEYSAIRKSAAILDMPQRGVLELIGKDRLSFLNNLLTNQTWDKQTKTGLSAGSGVYAFFLNQKGRIVCDMNVLEFGDRTMLEMDARLIEPLRKTLEKYLFAEQVKMASRVGELHELFVTGPGALEVLNSALDKPLGELGQLGCATGRLFGHEVFLFRDDICGLPGYALLGHAAALQPIWQHFTNSAPADDEDLRHHGLARPAGWAAFNTVRIEAGRPFFGIDFDESVLPAETGQMSRAVSLTKGCYLGQEIVARMHARGQLARQLTGIRMDSDALPIAGAKIYDEKQNEIGGVTSSTISPILSNIALCLGYVKRPFLTPGTHVMIPAEGEMRRGTVSATPFI